MSTEKERESYVYTEKLAKQVDQYDDFHGSSGGSACTLLPIFGARAVQKIVGLDEFEVAQLSQELENCDEDPILVFKLNPIWIEEHDQAAADAILDAVATWNLNPNPPDSQLNRRDHGGRRWIYHFDYSSDISTCRRAIIASHPVAFSLSPEAITLGAVGVATNPLAFSAVVHKLAVRQDDVEAFNFFYL